MAKPTKPAPAPELDETDESLVMLAEVLLGDYFIDPDKEQHYKRAFRSNRPSGAAGMLLYREMIDLESDDGPDTECTLSIEALRSLTHFRVGISHPDFAAVVEGVWSFDAQELGKPKVIGRTGDANVIEAAVEEMIQEIEGSGGDDAEFADFMDGLDDDDDEVPMIGDDPTEPPNATALDRSRVKAVAKRISRDKNMDLGEEDRGWLEQTPQVLPVIAEALVAAYTDAKRNDNLVLAYQLMLSLQLEYVRYRQDRGWEWADDMLQAYQQRLIVLAKEQTIAREDWFVMCAALSEARVPVSNDVATALAEAGFDPVEDAGPPEQMLRTIRGFLDQLADMVSSPFEVVESLQNSGALLPSQLRGFMATELALSPHEVLRDTVPLLLLDEDTQVRTAAAQALEQTAHPDTLSPHSLRRAITVRNWIPSSDRPALDTAIRKARVAGVEIGAWPAPTRDLEFYASTIDGSGAQSILIASRPDKKGLFAGILVRHGTGVVDTWIDPDLSRGKIGKLLKEAAMVAPTSRVDHAFADTIVQHAIGCSVAQDTAPPASLLELAEILGAAEWKDRRLDIAAEAERLFQSLDPTDRSEAGIEAGLQRGMDWMAKDDVIASWFEDGPQVQQALAKLARTDRLGMIAKVITDILPEKRGDWTERFLMMALWCQAAPEAKQRAKGRDLVQVAHALAADEPLEAIPAMALIATQTVRAALLGGW